MGKRTFSIILGLALGAGVFGAAPAKAQAVAVPDTVQIDDPKGDANFLNDQDNTYGTPVAGQGDHVLPADVGTATDIMKVWFSNTATEISLNIQLEGNPANLAYDTYFRFSSNAGQGPVANDTTRGCLEWIASVNGAAGAYTGATEGRLTDKCNVGTPVTGPLSIAEASGGGFVLTITFPRDASPLLADGQKVTAPFGVSRIVYVGPLPAPAPAFATGATVDNTKRGTDYAIAGGGPVVQPEPEPTEEPPGKSDPPGKGKKKGCKKGKGKKKGACPSPPTPPTAPSCPTYVPGDMGKDAPLTVVTDEATEDKPIEIDVPLGLATGNVGSDRTTRAKHNVQIDSSLAEAGFYARLEAPGGDDPDLYVYYASGKQAAVAGGFNPLLVGGPLPNPTNHATIRSLNGQGTGGHSEFTAEQIDGLRSPDCRGWTLDLVNWGGRGGTYTLKLWLGEIQNDPAPEQEAESESALATFFGMLLSR